VRKLIDILNRNPNMINSGNIDKQADQLITASRRIRRHNSSSLL
jgi:hypothetical protein